MTIVKRSLHPYNHTRLDQTLFLLETSWDLLRSRPSTRYVDYPSVLLCAPTGFPVELLLFLSLTHTVSFLSHTSSQQILRLRRHSIEPRYHLTLANGPGGQFKRTKCQLMP